MNKINQFKLELDNLEKRVMTAWDIIYYTIKMNDKRIKNSCELLIPMQKFVKHIPIFLRTKSNSFKIDPNDGKIVISLKRYEKNNFILKIQDVNKNKIEYEGLIDLNYFLNQFIIFFYDVIDIFIPDNKENEVFLNNLESDLKKIEDLIKK